MSSSHFSEPEILRLYEEVLEFIKRLGGRAKGLKAASIMYQILDPSLSLDPLFTPSNPYADVQWTDVAIAVAPQGGLSTLVPSALEAYTPIPRSPVRALRPFPGHPFDTYFERGEYSQAGSRWTSAPPDSPDDMSASSLDPSTSLIKLFEENHKSLAKEIHVYYTGRQCLNDAREFVQLFPDKAPSQPQSPMSLIMIEVQQHGSYQEYRDACNNLLRYNARTELEWRYCLVKLYQEFSLINEKGSAHNKSALDNFYPRLGKMKENWTYICQFVRPLSKAKERFGWGVLLFPLYGVRKTRFNRFKCNDVDAFVDYLGWKYPDLNGELRSLSVVLPRMIESGEKWPGLLINTTSSQDLATFDPQGFNQLFQEPKGTETYQSLEQFPVLQC